MKAALVLVLLLAGCAKEQPAYFLSITETDPDGTERSLTYSGPELPERLRDSPKDH